MCLNKIQKKKQRLSPHSLTNEHTYTHSHKPRRMHANQNKWINEYWPKFDNKCTYTHSSVIRNGSIIPCDCWFFSFVRTFFFIFCSCALCLHWFGWKWSFYFHHSAPPTMLYGMKFYFSHCVFFFLNLRQFSHCISLFFKYNLFPVFKFEFPNNEEKTILTKSIHNDLNENKGKYVIYLVCSDCIKLI